MINRCLYTLTALLLTLGLAHTGDKAVKQDAWKPITFPKMSDIKPDVRKNAEALILQLSAESFKDRKKARKELEGLGPSIIPLLETHLDDAEPEIRDALPGILESLRAKLNVTIPDIKLTLLMVKPGSFTMGTDSGYPPEKPAHLVTLTNGFWIGQTELTQAQYRGVMGKQHSYFKDTGKDAPMEEVAWMEAILFCKKLTKRERKAGRLPANREYRLPTEAEWEYCCRAGGKTKYGFGDDKSKLEEYAWYRANSDQKTHPVAQKKPNAWGLYDMHGNVREWCGDWYVQTYPKGAQADPKGPKSGSDRVCRGGSWFDDERVCTSTYRCHRQSAIRDRRCGFRIVLAHHLPKKEKGDKPTK